MINSILQAVVVISLAIAFGIFFGYRVAVSEKRNATLSKAFKINPKMNQAVYDLINAPLDEYTIEGDKRFNAHSLEYRKSKLMLDAAVTAHRQKLADKKALLNANTGKTYALNIEQTKTT